MKVQATIFKGIEFVSLQDLPADQQILLEHNNEVERIKILVDGKVKSNCIQYNDYSIWYTTIFVKSVTQVEVPVNMPVELAVVAVSNR
jgi:hypothetical protein